MLIQHGGNDKRLAPTDGRAYEAALTGCQASATKASSTPNAEHGFNNDTTPRFDAALRQAGVGPHHRPLQKYCAN